MRFPVVCGLVSVLVITALADNSRAPEFVIDAAEYRLGESVMIPLRVASEVSENTRHELRVENEEVLRVLRQPEILGGHDTGFARILTLAPGVTTLESGDHRMRVRVLDERPTSLLGKMRPRFTTPPEGARLWGEVAVSVDIWVGAPGIDRDAPPDAILHLPDGGKLKPTESFPPLDGPFWRVMFTLDTSQLPAGACELAVSCKPSLPDADGSVGRLTSDPHRVVILPPPSEGEIVAAGECEAMLDTPRSERMGSEPPGITLDPAASGHRAVALRRSRPEWVIQPDIKEPGMYQWMVRARGSLAGAAYPSLGVVVGENASVVGSSRIASAAWHRLAVGRPVKLEAGTQWIGLTIANEFNYRNLVQRMAEIDRFELRRLDDASSGGGGAMMAGGMMMKDGADEAAGKDNKAPAARDLRCAFATLVDGDPVNGRVALSGILHSPALRNDNDYRHIRSDLWINGERHASDHGRRPVFHVHPHDLKNGSNRIEFTSHSPCGAVSRSLAQNLPATAKSHPSQKLGITYDADRHDLRRGKWHAVKPDKIAADSPLAGNDAPPVFHAFEKTGATVRFDLPPQLTGKRRISILSRDFPEDTSGVLSVKLHQPKARHKALREMEIAAPPAGEHWEWQALASVDLDEGPKHLSITLLEGRAALGGVSIDTPKFLDAAEPEIEVLYPTAGTRFSSNGDAIVLRAFDDLKLSHFEVRIDGQDTPLALSADQDTGLFTLHLPAGVLGKGSGKLQVTAVDESGKRRATPVIAVEMVDETGQVLSLPYPRAVRLADRLGFGQDPRTIARILTMAEENWLNEELSASWGGAHDGLIDALAHVMFPDLNDYHIRGRVICELLATRKPVASRFAMFAQNHFSTWISKVGAPAKWEEHRAFRDLGIARFQDLLLTSATSPAMMVYLDQHSSLDRQLNENYARELMELHTVGVHGGYRQEDVTSLAQLLTGWGAQREAMMDGGAVGYEYRFSPYLNHSSPIEVFGLDVDASTAPESADDRIRQVIEMLACRPHSARFIAGKMVGHYLGMPADKALVDRLADEYLRGGGNLARMLAMLAMSPEFMTADPGTKLLTPVEFGIVTQRSAAAFHPGAVIQLGDRSGRNLFDRASPDGFPETNDEYADSNCQLQKWSYSKEVGGPLAATLPWSWFDAEKLKDEAHRDAVIDHAFAARRGRPPQPSTRDALHDILREEVADHQRRRTLFATLLHMMPEFQVR